MREDSLRTLLRQSYPIQPLTGRPPSAQQLECIFADRRRKRRRQGGLLVACVALGLLVMASFRPAHQPGAATVRQSIEADTVRPRPSSAAKTSPAALAMDASLHEIEIQREIVRRLQAIKRRQQAGQEYATLATMPSELSTDLERRHLQHRAAAMALLYADRLREQADGGSEALAEYKWIAEHFAGTPWAQRARERLDL